MNPETDTQVMTVTGTVQATALGVTDAHSHLYIAPVAGGAAGAPVLVDEDGVSRELSVFQSAGGGAIIDCQPGGCGRDGRVLRRLSRQTGIHVVAATGFHRRIYYPPDTPLFGFNSEAAAAYFRDEIVNGLPETRGVDHRPPAAASVVYPGVIKVAAEATVEASPCALFEAAASVASETGYAIEMHTERGAAVEEFLAQFEKLGVRPWRLVFCHVDKRPDFGLHSELARAGVMLEYDTFFRPKYAPEENVWPLIQRMAAAGLDGQIALATDMADSGLWAELGGSPGLLGFFSIIKAGLMRMDLPEATIGGLLGGNIARRIGIAKGRNEGT